jgi:hypothetical protein
MSPQRAGLEAGRCSARTARAALCICAAHITASLAAPPGDENFEHAFSTADYTTPWRQIDRTEGTLLHACTHLHMHSARCMHVASCITHPTRPHPHPCDTAAQSCRLSSYLTPVHCWPCLPRCTPLQLLQGRSVPGRPQALQAEAVCGARDAQGCLWQPVPSGGALRTRLAGGEGPGVSQISERAALTAVWGAAWVAAREEVPVPAASCTPHTRS